MWKVNNIKKKNIFKDEVWTFIFLESCSVSIIFTEIYSFPLIFKKLGPYVLDFIFNNYNNWDLPWTHPIHNS